MTAEAFEHWRGEMVMRTPEEAIRHREYLAQREALGNVVVVKTRRGTHRCTVVAVWQPGHTEPYRGSGWEWSSALSEARFMEAPRGHRQVGLGPLLLRIEDSTAPHRIGRYLERSMLQPTTPLGVHITGNPARKGGAS